MADRTCSVLSISAGTFLTCRHRAVDLSDVSHVRSGMNMRDERDDDLPCMHGESTVVMKDVTAVAMA